MSRLVRALRNAPNPRLTALGTGLFCVAAMFLLACLDLTLLGGSTAGPVVYGVLFLPVSALTALWVRPADLLTAPIAVPIGFAAGMLPLCGGTGGFGGRVVGLVTALAMNAGWLYGGTLIAGLIATVRKIRLMGRRAAVRQRAAAGTGGAALLRDGEIGGRVAGGGGSRAGGPSLGRFGGGRAGSGTRSSVGRASRSRQGPPQPRRRPA